MRLDHLAEVQTGYSFRSRLAHDPAGTLAVIQMKDLDAANNVRDDYALRVSLADSNDRHLLRPGDLLFRSRGRSYGASLVPDGIGPAVLAAPMLLIRPHRVLPAYLAWYLNARPTQTELAARAAGTSVQMISAEALKALEVPVPPTAVQKQIADLAALVEKEERLLDRITLLRTQLSTRLLMNIAHEATA